jgi:hypothetical protein
MFFRTIFRSARTRLAVAAMLAPAWALPVSAQGPPPSGPDAVRRVVARYRTAHEPAILREFADLLALPNLSSDSVNIRSNAAAVSAMMARRGIAVRFLESPSGGPS